MINHESYIQNISPALNESDVFLQWRLSMLASAEVVPKEQKEKFSYGLGIVSAVPYVGVFGQAESPYVYQWKELPMGARIVRWAEVMKNSALSAKIFSLFQAEKNKMVSNYFFALSAAFFSDGLVVVVNEGVSADIVLETKVSLSGADMLVVFAGAHSRVTVRETLSFQAGNALDMKGRTVFIIAEEKARVVYAEKIAAFSQGLFFINKKAFAQGEAHISFVESHRQSNGLIKSETAAFLDGGKSKANLVTFAETDGTAVSDNLAAVFHRADGTVSNIFSVGTASGLSKIISRSLIQAPAHIHAAVGRQEGNFLMLSSGAEIDAIPSLEVASDDTKTSHALSVRRLSEESLFYPRTRGFTTRDAESLIVRGLMEKALSATVSSERADIFSLESLL
ncbi:MAG: SufD family Fe-S cluster assembly protein [Candidatus Lloydbacteria bacterium]|nr:SufD family Fe-S cluster assembly protein [Candidatus Lloydbacteria bacterium]